ncbi:hypothetical protein GFS24_05985 [Chitinophaga sp. SYP-B3965]|uniref:hypothetical protein n=1 Tax=Chitinophaga sp. SYP-B3965 TaxID=2663120 RepID=UPI0012995782|nr:hypothetical protein [Chitinophaga sp. SYP-B3965]MRG44653.1 hypothetical protein [Chitinophaga sp. SYP-B3965]
MKKPLMILCCLFPLCAHSQGSTKWLQDWFKAWELVNSKLLFLPSGTPPEMVFYDDSWIFTTSEITAPAALPMTGPGMYGRPLKWRKVRHGDSLTIPDGQRVAIGLMSFAASTSEGKSFFVMGAPPFWKAAGVTSTAFTLDKMLTGVFLHEFTHTRQQKGFGRQVDSMERVHTFKDVPLSDDIVQGYFKADSEYVRSFKEEIDAFYTAAAATGKKQAKDAARKGLDLLKARQAKYFTGDKVILKTLDDIFLSMEGLGQYVAVYWLIHPQGGNVKADVTVSGFRRKRNQWSQEEGLAMFLALARLTEQNWIKDQFNEQPRTIVDLLEQAVK